MEDALDLIRHEAPARAAGLVLPAIRLHLDEYEPEAPEPGASRVGGRPDWPADRPWPRWRDTCMDFVGQLDLARLRGLPAAEALPATGFLWFFYTAYGDTTGREPEDAGSWAVVWADVPRASLAPSWLPPDFDLDASYPAFTLRAAAEWTMPVECAAAVAALGLGPEDQAAYERMVLRLSGLNGDDGGAIRLLGHPVQFQATDPLEVAAEVAPPGGSGPWRLLLQVTPPDHWGADWVIDWLIREDDLAAGRFDRTWLYREE